MDEVTIRKQEILGFLKEVRTKISAGQHQAKNSPEPGMYMYVI